MTILEMPCILLFETLLILLLTYFIFFLLKYTFGLSEGKFFVSIWRVFADEINI